MDTRIVRLFNVYGPRMSLEGGKVIPNFIRSALSGENISIRGNGMQTRCFLYIDDAVEALIRTMNADGDMSRPVNIGSADPIRIDALAEDIINLTGSPSKVTLLDLPTESSLRSVPDIAYARQRLGWEPLVPIEEGLIRTMAYFEKRMRSESRIYPFFSWAEMM